MAHFDKRHWDTNWDAPTRRDKRGGEYSAYVPDGLVQRGVVLSPELAREAARIEARVRRMTDSPGATGLDSLSRFLLRSEAIASSRIEGLQVSAQQVALAEFAGSDDLPVAGFTDNARLVANNIVTLRQATDSLAASDDVGVEEICLLHRALLPNHAHQGLRQKQNWIGGGDYNPLDADFVPPPEEEVRRLMEDLTTYLAGAVHAPLIQAALVHAQFETIHPFADGNGRVGRALIHTVLTRRGLTRAAVLPVSMVLLTRSDEYVAGLTAYRYVGRDVDPASVVGVETWIGTFLAAVDVAVEQAEEFRNALAALQDEWSDRHLTHRAQAGYVRQPRADAAAVRLLPLLCEVPIVTGQSAQRLLNVSAVAAKGALDELAGAGILYPRQVGRGTTAYLARSVFDLLTLTERRLASTRWDTREAKPGRPVPARPQP